LTIKDVAYHVVDDVDSYASVHADDY
jgi:hypothetical protein